MAKKIGWGLAAILLLSGIQTGIAQNLIFWNKLGSDTEIQNSMVGVDGKITGTMPYVSGNFGNAVSVPAGYHLTVVFTNVINQANQFTVECWMAVPRNYPDGTKYLNIFAITNVSNAWGGGLGINPSGQVDIGLYTTSGYCAHYRWNGFSSITSNVWRHFAIAFDGSGAAGKKMRLYVDGVLKSVSTILDDNTWSVSQQMNLAVGSLPNMTDNMPVYVDNMKIWNYVKTNFSDRSNESAGYNMPPAVSVSQPDGVGDTADASYTVNYSADDPDDAVTVSLYYDTDNTGYDGTLIASGLAETTVGTYVWNTTALANGAYYVYAVVDDGVNAAVKAYSSGPVTVDHKLIFWNKLGSASEAVNSEVGPKGTIQGTGLGYTSVKFGDGIVAGDRYSSVVYSNVFGTVPVSQWTIEAWVKFGDVPDAQNPCLWMGAPATNGTSAVYPYFFCVMDHNGSPDRIESLNFTFTKAPGSSTSIEYVWYFTTPFSSGDLEHIAVSVDLARADGDKVRLYLNGVLCDSSLATLSCYGSMVSNTYTFPTYFFAGHHNISADWVDYDAVDNLKIWNYAKADFSERCSEDGSTTCASTNVAPAIRLSKPEKIDDAATNSYLLSWIDSDPDNNAYINLYRDKDHSGYDGTLIVSGISEDADGTNGSYVWNLADVDDGTYHIYAIISDGVNPPVKAYAPGTVKVRSKKLKKKDPCVEVSDDIVKPGKNQNFDIGLNIPDKCRITVDVYDLQGNHVVTLAKDQEFDSGYYHISWDLKKDIGSGVYWIVMKGDNWTKRKRVAIVR